MFFRQGTSQSSSDYEQEWHQGSRQMINFGSRLIESGRTVFSANGFQRFVEAVSRGRKIDPHWLQQGNDDLQALFWRWIGEPGPSGSENKPTRPILSWLTTSKQGNKSAFAINTPLSSNNKQKEIQPAGFKGTKSGEFCLPFISNHKLFFYMLNMFTLRRKEERKCPQREKKKNVNLEKKRKGLRKQTPKESE